MSLELDETYPFDHAEHAYLTGRLGHVDALLRNHGYQEFGCEVAPDRPNCSPGAAASPAGRHTDLSVGTGPRRPS